MDNQTRTEFNGGGVMPNTVHPKGEDALTNGEKLRLQSITGQETDSKASPDPGFWQGNEYFDPTQPAETYEEWAEKIRRIEREEASRYDETPRE